jgi:dethiobiotin synthetase
MHDGMTRDDMARDGPPRGGSARAAPRIAVTGTDTGVGKTVVACALVAALGARGLMVGTLKPVETGVTRRDGGTDAERLRAAAGDADPLEVVGPLTYAEPLAPWVAAERTGRPVDLARLDALVARHAAERDALVVEGAGGLLVPFTRTLTFADLAARWALDVVVVAANRLGVLNHALLTVREAARRGLAVRAVALVEPPNGASDVAERTNAETLAALIAPVPLVPIPRLGDDEIRSREALARIGMDLATLLCEA